MFRICSCVFVLDVLFSGISIAQPSITTTVYPTGIFPNDVQNVQAAINLGGTVMLKATNSAGEPAVFNFGTPENLPGRNVSLTTDVRLIGEQMGSRMTTIQGGFSPINSTLVAVRSVIQGIDFEGPGNDAVSLYVSAGAEIVGNRINGVVPGLTRFGFTFADGIAVNNAVGKVRVAGNVIENFLQADLSIGIQFDGYNFEGVAGDIEITGNTIGNASSYGILAIRGHSSILISQNIVAPASNVGAAIDIGGDQDAAYTVSGNSVVTDGAFPDGIIVSGGDGDNGTVSPAVKNNHVVMHNSLYGGVSIYGLVTGALVGENDIEGDGAFALQVNEGFNPVNSARSNTFRGNNISHFSTSLANIFLGPNSISNLVLGECKSVIDLGVDDRVTCGVLSIGNPSSARTAKAQRLNETRERLLLLHQRPLP
jgi:hypothetical protein